MARIRNLLFGTGTVLLLLASARPGAAEIWETRLAGDGSAAHVVVALPGGDVVAAGLTHVTPTVAGTAVRLDDATGAVVWRRDLTGTFSPSFNELVAAAADSAGGVFVGGRVRNVGTDWDWTVVKLSAADGSVVWRRDIDGTGDDTYDPGTVPPFDHLDALAVDAAGDVFAAGQLVEGSPSGAHLGVKKLSGVDGTTIWEHDFERGAAGRMLVDAAGNVILGGSSFAPGLNQVRVAKLSGLTGAEIWRYETPGTGGPVALDAFGNVVTGGVEYVPPPPGSANTDTDFLVVKLDGATGTTLWRLDVPGEQTLGLNGAVDVGFDASGDVIAGGFIWAPLTIPNRVLAVFKLAGSTGMELWARLLQTPSDAVRIATDGAGHVFAAGSVATKDNSSNFAVLALDGSDGTVVWRREADGGIGVDDGAQDMVVDSGGDLVAVGMLNDASHGFAALKFAGATGSDYLLAGNKLRVTDTPTKGRRIGLSSKTPIFPPLPLVAGTDPRTGGASLELANPGTGEHVTLPLPAAGWTGLGAPSGSAGYRYTDHGHALGPCSKVILTSTALSARCAGTDIGFTLDEPSQGTLAVRVLQGSLGLRRCLLFGGSVRVDRPRAFLAHKAPAPAVCP